MRISIVTTSFNQGAFLEQTIQSVLSQGYPELEYIIIDGGSSDDSVSIIRKYADRVAYWISEPDRGQGHALNKGFARATGDIFAFINSDDYFEPGSLVRMADAFRAGAQWVVGNVRYRRDGGGEWPLPPYPAKSRADWLLFCPIPQPGCFWSAELSRRYGPFREDLQFTMDYEFWLRLRFEVNLLPKIVDAPIAVYRLHDASKTVAQNRRFADEARALRQEYSQMLTPAERARFWLARKHRKARRNAIRAREMARSGQTFGAFKKLAGAYLCWPPLAADPRGYAALWRTISRSTSRVAQFPFVWSDPDD